MGFHEPAFMCIFEWNGMERQKSKTIPEILYESGADVCISIKGSCKNWYNGKRVS